MEEIHRNEIWMLKLGIGFLGIGVLIPLAIPTTTFSEYNPVLQLISPYSVGTVYIIFGSVIWGWRKRTECRQVPFSIISIISGVAIATIIGIWVFIFLPRTSVHASTLLEYLERTVLYSPAVWIGCHLVWILAYNFASSLYHRAFVVIGIAAIPLTVAVSHLITLQSVPSGMGAGLVYFVSILLTFLSILSILFAFAYAYPLSYLDNEIRKTRDKDK